MAARHPYVQSLSAIVQVLDQLRKSFPLILNADVLKRLSLAPNTENRVIDLLRFLGLLDDQNNRTDIATQVFTLHDPAEFQSEFAKILRNAYGDLFELYKDDAWSIDQTKLITFFRRSDQSTERVGSEQSRTFKTLAAYAGYGEPLPAPRTRNEKPEKQRSPAKTKQKEQPSAQEEPNEPQTRPLVSPDSTNGLSLTVRIEINLPVAPDQETYDRIFKSIRENLLNG